MNSPTAADPFQILGISPDSSEGAVRARYLELVKQFPPERDPDKFREIRAAFEASKDPLAVARNLLIPPDETFPEWTDVLKEQQRNPPRLSTAFLLSLGNREAVSDATVGSHATASGATAVPTT